MRPFFVVVCEEPSKVRPCVKRVPVLLQVDLFVFDGSPQSFYEDIIQAPASAVHADVDPVILQNVSEILVSVLRPLVGVEDFWTPMGDKGFFQRTDAKG